MSVKISPAVTNNTETRKKNKENTHDNNTIRIDY